MPRPAEPFEAAAVEPDLDWSTDPILFSGRQCRFGSPRYGFCGRRPVAVLFRPVGASRGKRGKAAWAYCEQHLYGRWIEGGVVVQWRAVR